MRILLLAILFGLFYSFSFSVFAWETPSTRFVLKQSDNNTTLQYNGKILYKWGHDVKFNPFSWSQGCDAFNIKLNEINDEQKTWESLGQQKQKSCLKEYYFRAISVKNLSNSRFYSIVQTGYEGVSIFLFDSKTQILYTKIGRNTDFMDSISKIEVGKSGIYVQYVGNRGNCGGLIFIKEGTSDGVLLFSNTDDSEKITMKSFELMPNKKVKVTYTKRGDSYIFQKTITIK